jgi:hypothetical protein
MIEKNQTGISSGKLKKLFLTSSPPSKFRKIAGKISANFIPVCNKPGTEFLLKQLLTFFFTFRVSGLMFPDYYEMSEKFFIICRTTQTDAPLKIKQSANCCVYSFSEFSNRAFSGFSVLCRSSKLLFI